MEKRKLAKEEVKEIVRKVLKEKLSDLVDKMYESGKMENIAVNMLVDEYGGWSRTVDDSAVPPLEKACIPLKVSEELKGVEEDYVKSIAGTLKEEVWNYLKSFSCEIEVAYDRDGLINDIVLVLYDLSVELDYDLEKVVELSIKEDWLKDILNGDYWDEEGVREAIESLFEENEEVYERLEEIVESLCDFNGEFRNRLEKFLEFARQYIQEVCEELEEETEEEEEQPHVK